MQLAIFGLEPRAQTCTLLEMCLDQQEMCMHVNACGACMEYTFNGRLLWTGLWMDHA